LPAADCFFLDWIYPVVAAGAGEDIGPDWIPSNAPDSGRVLSPLEQTTSVLAIPQDQRSVLVTDC
jgi:hypothetical protein